jgi:hypothetical protein
LRESTTRTFAVTRSVVHPSEVAGAALARAGGIYEGLGFADQARDAYRRLVALPGLSDPSVKAKVDMARMRLDAEPAAR